MLNEVLLQGRLTDTPELKRTPNGVGVTSFTLAVERDYQNTPERETDFINIVAWRNTAEFISKYFTKGKMMILRGSLQIRKYTNKNGENRYVTEVIADKVFFAGDKANADESANFGGDTEEFTEITDDSDLPF